MRFSHSMLLFEFCSQLMELFLCDIGISVVCWSVYIVSLFYISLIDLSKVNFFTEIS